jgi:hypothetical protein
VVGGPWAGAVGNEEEGKRKEYCECREEDVAVVRLGVPAEEFVSIEEAEVEDWNRAVSIFSCMNSVRWEVEGRV